MKLVSFGIRSRPDPTRRLGLYHDGKVLAAASAGASLSLPLPDDMAAFLAGFDQLAPRAREINHRFLAGELADHALAEDEVRLLAPVPRPTSLRDAYAFRQHVATARQNRGLPMIPEFDEFPVFYFSNHLAVIGPGDVAVEQDHVLELDFELEVAAVIGKGGRNIAAEAAEPHIAGFTIMNDLSARTLQREEMRLNLGPAKGKDFATALGPWLVTLDELTEQRVQTPAGATWDLPMRAWHNGAQVSSGNLGDMTWTFAEIIERASYGVDLWPGDVIGSGTVGTGCYLELNGTRKLAAAEAGAPFEPVWLQPGDTVELEVQGLGRLRNCIREPGRYSILARKRSP